MYLHRYCLEFIEENKLKLLSLFNDSPLKISTDLRQCFQIL